MPRAIPTELEVMGYAEKYRNWGRWGPDDKLGTVNFVTPAKTLRALSLVKEGVTVSSERPFEFAPSVDVPTAYARHTHDAPGGESLQISLHGGGRTHMDSLTHGDWKGTAYNGLHHGEGGGIDALGQGVVSKGVLLDIARLKKKDWLEPGEAIFPEDLDAAEKAEGVRVEEGDILLVRTGHARRRLEKPHAYGPWPGHHATCIPWFHERRIAVLGTDTPNDVSPSGYPGIGLTIHKIAIANLGLWIIDHCNHEDLTKACQQRNRWDFLFMLAPLKMPGCTGSPVNPIAVF